MIDMKKMLVIAAALVLGASAAHAQDWLGSFLKTATEQVGDIISGSSAVSSALDIKGTWKYKGCAIETSSDNVLAGLAGSLGSSSIESKVDGYLAKVGIKAGAATFQFNEDGSFTLIAGKISIPGTWTKEGTKLTINFCKLFTFKLVGTIKGTSTGCEILFESEKFLQFVQKVANVIGSVTSQNGASALSGLLNNVNGLKLGFKLSK